jgi:bifunctional DNA-binding transcriptional regulator/antitoxin component of YhaV-PrlF toxin-antitoxin module
MSVVRVRERGQVTLPREVREAAGVTVGSELLILPIGPGKFTVQVLPQRESLLALIDEFADVGPAPDLEVLRQQIGQTLAADFARGEVADGD